MFAQMKKNASKIGTMAVMALALSSCGGGGGGGGGGGLFLQPWYNVYGEYCGSGDPGPGCNFYADGVQIIDLEDPYFLGSYLLEFDVWLYTDSFGFDQLYTGWAWNSPNGILYDDLGNALNEEGSEQGRDVLGDVAEAEAETVANVGKDFAGKFALSEDAGVRMAETLNDFATLAKERARTSDDMVEFTERLYGVTMSQAKQALLDSKAGDKTAVVGLNTDIANYWGTSPETSSEIMKVWYEKQLSKFDIE